MINLCKAYGCAASIVGVLIQSKCSNQTCCKKGEKVSTPLDKDGRDPCGL